MKIVTVVGARPQFVKAAAVSYAISQYATSGGSAIEEFIVHTGQHYDFSMSEIFFEELTIPSPREHLEVGSANHGVQTGEIMRRFEPVVLAETPQAVLVYGDTNSTLAGALVATKLHVPVIHVEAGLRSFDRTMPEEINRVVTDHVSDLLLCPSPSAVQNLESEGIRRGVHLVGDVMYDAMLRIVSSMGGINPVAERLHLGSRPYVVVTVHRPANTDDPKRFSDVAGALGDLATAGFDVVFPVHPRMRSMVENWIVPDGVHTTEPLGHRDMLCLVQAAHAVATDSGGLQKEAAWLGTPCITLRHTTEWIETIAEGWNVLVGTDRRAIVEAVATAEPPSQPFVAYGTGGAAEAVVKLMVDAFG
jgi:UDP-GlcNAc3NAcA epimerase